MYTSNIQQLFSGSYNRAHTLLNLKRTLLSRILATCLLYQLHFFMPYSTKYLRNKTCGFSANFKCFPVICHPNHMAQHLICLLQNFRLLNNFYQTVVLFFNINQVDVLAMYHLKPGTVLVKLYCTITTQGSHVNRDLSLRKMLCLLIFTTEVLCHVNDVGLIKHFLLKKNS